MQHAKGKKHQQVEEERKEDLTASKALLDKRNSALDTLALPLSTVIRLVYWLCAESIAMLKLASLYTMITSLPKLAEAFGSAIPKNYVNAARCRDFVMALDSVIKVKLWEDILSSPYVSVLIDESTDISTSENLIIYIAYLKDNRPKARYVGLKHAAAVDAESLTPVVVDFLTENGLPMSRAVCASLLLQ